MNNNLIIGVVLLVAGAILLYMGYQETQTLGARLSGAFGSNISTKAILMLAGGGIAALLGLGIVVKKGRG